jgi:hypothetical protein
MELKFRGIPVPDLTTSEIPVEFPRNSGCGIPVLGIPFP